MSMAEDVKLNAYWEATQSYPFCVFAFNFFQNKNIIEEQYYEGRMLKKSGEQASKRPNEFF